MTMAMNIHEEICAVQKGGGIPLTVQQILKCTQIAKIKVKEISETLKHALKQDEEKRKLAKVPTYAKKETIAKQQKELDLNDDDLSDDMPDSDNDEEMKPIATKTNDEDVVMQDVKVAVAPIVAHKTATKQQQQAVDVATPSKPQQDKPKQATTPKLPASKKTTAAPAKKVVDLSSAIKKK